MRVQEQHTREHFKAQSNTGAPLLPADARSKQSKPQAQGCRPGASGLRVRAQNAHRLAYLRKLKRI